VPMAVCVCTVDVVEAGMLERVDVAAASNASARQQRELRNAAAALVLQLLSAPLLPNASAMVRATHVLANLSPHPHTSSVARHADPGSIAELCATLGQVGPWRVTDATRAFVEQRRHSGLVAWLRAGGGAAELQLWALGVAQAAARGWGCVAVGVCAASFVGLVACCVPRK
jgi:hypothetical protein